MHVFYKKKFSLIWLSSLQNGRQETDKRYFNEVLQDDRNGEFLFNIKLTA